MKKFILLTLCVYSKLMPRAVMVQPEAEWAAAKLAEVEHVRQLQANQAAAHRAAAHRSV